MLKLPRIPLPHRLDYLLHGRRTRRAKPSPFDIPIVATHFTGETCAPDMWGTLKLAQAKAHLAAIRANGFNTVIVPVPWAGFHTSFGPNTWQENFFTLLDGLFETAKLQGLRVILRLGYLYELHTPSEPNNVRRALDVFWIPETRQAWFDYLGRMRELTARHDNFLFSFLSWEDFLLLWTMDQPLDIRLALGRGMGFQEFLDSVPLKRISFLYDRSFASRAEVPIPRYDTPAAALYFRFLDHKLLELLRDSRQVYPDLQLEVRSDWDPLGRGRGYSHETTFDLGGLGGITVVYFTTAWGALNQGDSTPGHAAALRLDRMLHWIRRHTDNPIFIDQFNFVDNTVGFSGNTRMGHPEVREFLEEAAGILGDRSLGYSLWTMQDKPQSILTNGSFALGELYWKIRGGRIADVPDLGPCLNLDQGGLARHPLVLKGGMIGVSDPEAPDHPLTLRLRAVNPDSERASGFTLSVLSEDGEPFLETSERLAPGQEKTFEYTDIPWFPQGSLDIGCPEHPIRIETVQLFAFVQMNGIYDINGEPRPFRDALTQLNARFQGRETPTEPAPEHRAKL